MPTYRNDVPQYQNLNERPSPDAFGVGMCGAEGRLYFSDGTEWVTVHASDGRDTVIANLRQEWKNEAKKAPLIRAAAWAIGTVYTLNAIARHSNGQLMQAVVGGTSHAATEPTFNAGAAMTDNTVTWAALGIMSRVNNDGYQVPTITANATAPAGSAIRLCNSTTKKGMLFLGTVTAGSGYTDGVYNDIPLTTLTGTGSGGRLKTLTVTTGAVASVVRLELGTGSGYAIGDTLSCAASYIGGTGSGFVYTITNVIQEPYDDIITNFNAGAYTAQTFGLNGYIFNNGGAIPSTQSETFTWGFSTDDPKPAITMSGASATARVLITVDGYPLEENYTPFTGSGTLHYALDWSGVRKMRNYIVETTAGVTIRGVSLLPQSVFTPYRKKFVKGIYFGDSYGGVLSTYSMSLGMRPLAVELFYRLGIRGATPAFITGTGYYTGKDANDLNTSATKYNLKGLLDNNQWAAWNPDVIVICHGINDLNYSAQSVVNAKLCWAKIAARWPKAVVIVFGTWTDNADGVGTYTTWENAMQTAFSEFDNPNFVYHSILQDPSGAWTTGTGMWGTTTGTGNADFYVGADSIHPTLPGREYLLQKLTDVVESELVSRGL